MPSDRTMIQFLLDEHYPAWLAENLTADGIDTVALMAHRPTSGALTTPAYSKLRSLNAGLS
ncbi:hypothetical protein [Jiangella asiatica]|uniref:DUF5615 domain-containing protein n=1 Tax=Jiangella asiatica TaxID=2530372 RepID=A0A4V2Z0D7_9ACTN|nr:hypothetical protein [Jiangella asiatica]TDE00598.1 hypothetical protein E1269_25125 [Jiangella asiatica]